MADKVTIPQLQQMKRDAHKIVGVVAWDCHIARIADWSGVEILSVGDSVGVNLWGHSNPFTVTMDQMLTVAQAVRAGTTRALLSCDLPYGPLQDSVDAAVEDYIKGDAPPPGAERDIGFEADTIEYDSDADTVIASGNVVLRDGDRSVRADEVRWDRPAGQIQASGNVRFVDADGNQLYASELELTDKFETGALSDLLLVLREGGRLAAESGERTDDGRIALVRGAYSGCAVTTPEGCPKRPSWH